MRILIASEYFPSVYKPYVQDQAAEFVRQGAEVSFVAFGRWGEGIGDRLRSVLPEPHVQYLPDTVRDPGDALAAVGRGLRRPMFTARSGLRIARSFGFEKRSLSDLARVLAFDARGADVLFVHNLSTMVALRALPVALPDLPIAMLYHGGEVPGTAELRPDEVRAGLSGVRLGVVNTRYAARHLAERGFPSDRIVVTPLGLYPDDFASPEGRTFMPGGVLRLLFVGRLSPEKGLLDVFRALAQLRPDQRSRIRFRVGGGGIQGDELRAAAASLGSCVEFVGPLDRAGVVAEMAAADCLVLASVPMQTWEENQGVVLQEAMCSGLPVLTTRTGGLEEVVPATSRKLQVAPGSPHEIAARLGHLMTLSADDWRAWSRECAQFVRTHFDIERETATVLRSLARLVEEGASASRL